MEVFSLKVSFLLLVAVATHYASGSQSECCHDNLDEPCNNGTVTCPQQEGVNGTFVCVADLADIQDLREKYTTMEKDVENLKKENAKLQNLQEELLKENEKQGQRNLEFEAELESVQKECDEGRDITDGLRDDIRDVREDINVATRKLANNENNLVELAGCCKGVTQTPVVPGTSAAPLVTTLAPGFSEIGVTQASVVPGTSAALLVTTLAPGFSETGVTQTPVVSGTSVAPLVTTPAPGLSEIGVTQTSVVPGTSAAPGKNYSVYAVFDGDIAGNITIGSRVIQGEDRTLGNEIGGGPGTVIGWIGDGPWWKNVTVRWDTGRKGTYLAMRLYLITGGDADHLAGTSTLRFKPIFRADLEAAVTIGSRVIRGEDWFQLYGDEDGRGPGTVTEWYNDDKSSRVVRVDWDRGFKGYYYWLGHNGKYRLFLLDE